MSAIPTIKVFFFEFGFSFDDLNGKFEALFSEEKQVSSRLLNTLLSTCVAVGGRRRGSVAVDSRTGKVALIDRRGGLAKVSATR